MQYAAGQMKKNHISDFSIIGFDIKEERISELFAGHDSTLEVEDSNLQSVIASARNEWISSTERTVFDRIDAMLTDQEDDDQADTEQDEEGAP